MTEIFKRRFEDLHRPNFPGDFVHPSHRDPWQGMYRYRLNMLAHYDRGQWVPLERESYWGIEWWDYFLRPCCQCGTPYRWQIPLREEHPDSDEQLPPPQDSRSHRLWLIQRDLAALREEEHNLIDRKAEIERRLDMLAAADAGGAAGDDEEQGVRSYA